MKKIIFNKLFIDIFVFFVVCSMTLTLIVWVLQAVNFLDIVSEDGHSLLTYFAFSFLNIPKIFSKLFLLSFFISIFYVLTNYEEKNQTLIFWVNGINKKDFIQKIIFLSIIFGIISFLISYFVVPYSQNKARSFIRSSNLDFFPSLIKPRKFIDTVERFTIFIDDKNKNSLNRVLIKDLSKDGNSRLIISKGGKIVNFGNENFIQLKDGVIINYGKNNNLNSFNFKKTNINLNQYNTKTTTNPKIQEIKSSEIFNCLVTLKEDITSTTISKNLTCDQRNLATMTQELYKRVILPFYIPLIAIIATFICIKSNNNFAYKKYKIQIFLTGVLFVIISQLSINFFNLISLDGLMVGLIPFAVSLISYIYFLNKIKKAC